MTQIKCEKCGGYYEYDIENGVTDDCVCVAKDQRIAELERELKLQQERPTIKEILVQLERINELEETIISMQKEIDEAKKCIGPENQE